MNNIFPINLPLNVVWHLSKPDGTPFNLNGYTYRIYYKNGKGKNEAASTAVTAAGNTIHFTYTTSMPRAAGMYALQLLLFQNNKLVVDLNYNDAFGFSTMEVSGSNASESQEEAGGIVHLYTVAEFYLLQPIVPVVGDDGFWWVNGARLITPDGENVAADHTVEYDPETKYIIIDKDRVDAHGQSIQQTITDIADALSYMDGEEADRQEAEGQGDYSDPSEYPDSRRAKEAERQENEAARQQAEGDSESEPGDGSRVGNELQRIADEGTPSDEEGADTRWGAEKARRAAEGTPEDDPDDPEVNTRWAQYKRSIAATERANNAAAAAEHMVDIKTGPQGPQGNTGSSVDYPYELVNNVTTDDATKGLSAAQGVVLDGKISQLGQWGFENPEWLKVICDSKGRILFGIKTDGSVEWFIGIPTPVRNYVETLFQTYDVAEVPQIVSFIGDLVEGDKDLEEILNSINSVIPVSEQNSDYYQVEIDGQRRIIAGTKTNGEKVFYSQVTIKGNCAIDGPLLMSGNNSYNEGTEQFIKRVTRAIPQKIYLPEQSKILATYDNIIVKYFEEDNVEYLSFSKNLGASWTEAIENTIGDITHSHIFSDGTVLLCGRQACYYADGDYSELHQTTIYDIDGSVYVPERDGFYSQMYHDRYFFHNGIEMDIFGEYVLEDTQTSRQNLKARIWYSTDNGHTIKCAFKSGTTTIGGSTITVRHIHYVGYCEANGKFYITTGDNDSETYLIEGEYDTTLDSWSFSIVGSGSYFKFGYFWFDDLYAYFLTDYTANTHSDRKGILRCRLNGLDTFSNYVNLYVCPEDEWGEIAIVNIFIAPNGFKVLFPDYIGLGYIWVATNGYNFKKVALDRNELIGFNTLGPNLNNEVIAIARDSTLYHNINSMQYSLTELLRNNGFSFLEG